jgi:FlaA1/EpsC-like NDP-sugar epimerase
MFLLDLGAIAAAGLLAFLLRFEFSVPHQMLPFLRDGLLAWVIVKALTFWQFQLYRTGWRYVSIPDVLRLGLAVLCGSACSVIVIHAIAPGGFPRSVYIIDCLLSFLATAANRLAARLALEVPPAHRRGGGQRTLIYGAGNAGVLLLRETRMNPKLGYSVVGFVDDNDGKRGQRIQGVSVLGKGPDVPAVVSSRHIEQVLIAIPSASGPQMTKILEYCQAAGVQCKTVPGMVDMVEHSGLARQIREVAVEDLLGRTPIKLDQDHIRERIHNKVVLVTGAAGSIGSELCRQIARFKPAAIVGFENGETALFHLDREMHINFPDVTFYPEIGSVQDVDRLNEVFRTYSPVLVYHAAAYKHVPMMEMHVFEAVKNNILGTWNVALAAERHGVDEFVMISTDKAVHPTSVMGATKRMAELLIRSLQTTTTKFVSVRFGNVLGSNGSVIPLFKQQIARGGPITVTHPDMRRFFMTIPEASQLVLQASTMGTGGEIFVLEMGAPVKIVDLAKNLILLSGLRPGKDIKIEFTGARPGEKLYEELNLTDEQTIPTPHEKIRIFAGNSLPDQDMIRHIDILRDLCAERDTSGLLLYLKDLIPDYNPSSAVLRRVLGNASAAVG